jgi:hypothetical protein
MLLFKVCDEELYPNCKKLSNKNYQKHEIWMKSRQRNQSTKTSENSLTTLLATTPKSLVFQLHPISKII